jgi:hypothetical protein
MHVNNACMFYAQYASIVVWKSQNGAETLVNLGARKKLTCFDPLRKGCGDFFLFFVWQLLVQHTIPTTFNSHKKINEIILFQNSPVQPLTMPPGRYGARHIAWWSVSVASCEAIRFRHRVCARAISARRTPWSSHSPLVKTQHKTQLLAIVYRTFLLAKLSNFVTQKGPSTHVINATRFVKTCQ